MRILIILSLIFTSHHVLGQIFDVEQAPPSIKWQQIHTENFQLIFSEEMKKEASLLAGKLDSMIVIASASLGKTPRKFSIILQNQLVESNGFVQLGPRRTEFYTTPPQQGDYQNWLDMLAIHELRHVAQMDKLTGNLKAPFFEQLAFALYGVTLPAWFFEGDAVLTETLLTHSGRGRLPSWEMPFRTNILSDKSYTYQKDYMGSFRDLTPGFYELGFFMVDKMRREQGPFFLDSLMTYMAKNLVRPYNFSRALRRFTGYNTRSWHAETVRELHEKWKTQIAEINPEDYPIFPNTEPAKPKSWLLPQQLPNGHIIALYRSVEDVPTLVSLDSTGTQKRLVRVGRQNHPHFSYSRGLVVWDEVRTHSRYTKQSYSIIHMYDLENKRHTQLTKRSRFFSPTLSPTADRVATVEIDHSNRVSIVLLNTEDGSEISRFPSPQNMLLRTPKFDEDGHRIIATGVSEKGAALVELCLLKGEYNILWGWEHQQIERPNYYRNDIFFKAHYNGIDNIYRWERKTNTVYAITNAAFGAFNPAIDTAYNALLFNQYQADGYRIGRLKLDQNANSLATKIDATTERAITLDLSDLSTKTTNDTTSTQKLAYTRYSEVKNLINFHSLSLSDGNPTDINNFKTGIYWLSDNLLNTMQIRAGYDYDPDQRTHNYSASVSYQRFFPKFALSYRNRGQTGITHLQNMPDSAIHMRWREQVTSIRMDIPLVFHRLNHVYATGLSTGTSYTNRYHLNHPELADRFINHIAFPMSYLVYFNRNNRRSTLDLAPRWGQNLTATYRHLPFDGNRTGHAFSFRSTFYFPGVARNHSLRARFNYQKTAGTFRGLYEIPLVSGFSELQPTQVHNTLLFNYQMPFAYPDWSIGPIAYIKRLKGGFFADFQNVGHNEPLRPRTYGAEIRADMNLLRFYLPLFDMGIKLVVANEANAARRAFVTYSIAYSY